MSDDGRTVGGAEDGADLSRHDPVLPDLDSLMPEISFDFESRGHDYDTTIDDSQDLTQDDSEMGGSVEDHGEGHTLKALFQVDNTPAVNRRPKSPSRAPVMPMAMMGESEIQSPTITEEDTVEVADRSSADRRPTRRTNFVIDFPSLTDEQRNEYVRIESKIVEAVTAEDITEAGSIYYEVQFTDGRQEMVSRTHLKAVFTSCGLESKALAQCHKHRLAISRLSFSSRQRSISSHQSALLASNGSAEEKEYIVQAPAYIVCPPHCIHLAFLCF